MMGLGWGKRSLKAFTRLLAQFHTFTTRRSSGLRAIQRYELQDEQKRLRSAIGFEQVGQFTRHSVP